MDTPNVPRGLFLKLDPDDDEALAVLKALAFRPRLQILELLSDGLFNLSEIAEALEMPLSTANLHVNTLAGAGLLLTEHRPASRGSQKVCTRAYDTVALQLPQRRTRGHPDSLVSMPIGGYVDCHITPSCGLTTESGIVGLFDDPGSFYHPDRLQAQLLWFHSGYVEYRFPLHLPGRRLPKALGLSLELCSEAPLHHDDWPSDITVWMNGVEIGSWLSPADFGGQRGRLTPDWWETRNSQYGLLKLWRVGREGSMIDGLKASEVRIDDLDLDSRPYLSVRIGVKEDARHVGGVNIFGSCFGNYPQDIVLSLRYDD